MIALNETHELNRRCWVASANAEKNHFPIQNLPFGVFRKRGEGAFRGGVAIGDAILDLQALAAKAVLRDNVAEALALAGQDSLNDFMGLGQGAWSALRRELSNALTEGSELQPILADCLVAQAAAEYAIPAKIGDYTDFYTSIHHATNIGKLFRPDNPLLPNYKWVPIGYHGRSSSIVVSGNDVQRPYGQLRQPEQDEPSFQPCQRLDYELEMGVFMGPGNALGTSIAMDDAESHVFGLCLLNDWSARDIQAWEYQPLGPFLAKSFASTISPWIVTMEALAPFRSPWQRPAGDPHPLAYLQSEANAAQGGLDIELSVALQSAQMRDQGQAAEQLALSNLDYAYWSVAQMVTHHSSNGCNLQPGDLLGTGTMSGPHKGSEGALIEQTLGGKQPVELANGEQRRFLADGDRVTMSGHCQRDERFLGFGEVSATVLAANQH